MSTKKFHCRKNGLDKRWYAAYNSDNETMKGGEGVDVGLRVFGAGGEKRPAPDSVRRWYNQTICLYQSQADRN